MNLKEACNIVWKECVRIKKNETALIVSDSETRKDPRYRISRTLWDTGKNVCLDCGMILMKKTGMNGREPPAEVAKAMPDYDVVIAPTKYSLTHTKASLRAARKGARIVTMPGITEDIFLRAIPVDYRKMSSTGKRLAERLQGKEIHIKTKAGTDLYVYRGGRKVLNCDGIMEKGKILNLPDGEVCFAPLEGKSHGILMVDLSSPLVGKVKKPFKILVENGRMVYCEEPGLWKALSSVRNGTNLAEFGIGTNPKAKITGKILEDEKVMGTAHIAFGTSMELGGKIQTSVHLDSVFSKPTIEVDGKEIIRSGRFLF